MATNRRPKFRRTQFLRQASVPTSLLGLSAIGRRLRSALFSFGHGCGHLAEVVLLLEDCPSGKCQSPCRRSSHCRHRGARNMAGRYQGYHLFRDEDGESRRSVEVFWEHSGWFWRPRFKGRSADGAAWAVHHQHPAYESAKRSAAPPTAPQT